jgi:energy-coupling factor transporter ATP-binding protein EcfA2
MTTILRKNLARDYALTLSWRYAEVEFLGLPNLKDERVFRLEDVYVPLRLCRDWRDRYNKGKSSYVPKVLEEQHHLVVLGDPGSGKSTLVKVLTFAFGEADTNAYKRACGELIPIPIILRSYNTGQWRHYNAMLDEFIQTLDAEIRNEITRNWLLEQIGSGNAILLIDGLDEVGSAENRKHLRNDIIVPLLRYAEKSYAVLTSRIVGYEEAAIEGYQLMMDAAAGAAVTFPPVVRHYVSPFDDDEIEQFIRRWYQLRESFPDKQREGVESLLSALSQNDRVKRLSHNPQLLTLIALIHRVTANLPSGRIELYDKIVEAYLETIQTYRKLGTPAKLDEMKRWLAKVAWEMQSHIRETMPSWDLHRMAVSQLLVSREVILGWLKEAIARERGEDAALDLADRFVEYVARRSGLLVEFGEQQFGFAHLTFQEYFAAFHLRGEVRRFDMLAKTCAGLVAKRLWHETLNLLFEMLTEFPGAPDDLLDEIAAQTAADAESRNGAAKLFSALLLDDQSGLSEAKEYQATAFCLGVLCDNGDEGVMQDLQSLSSKRRKHLIHPWFARGLYDERAHGRYFFLVGVQLLEHWPAELTYWVKSAAYRPTADLQTAEIVLIAAGEDPSYHEILSRAIELLPLNLWLRRIAPSFGDAGGLTLADLYRPAVSSIETKEPRDQLLLESGIALAITKSLILRLLLAMDGPVPYRDGPYDSDRKSARELDHIYDYESKIRRRLAIRAAAHVPPRDLARVFAVDLSEDGDGGVRRELARALARETIPAESGIFAPPGSNDRLAVLAAAERALFLPEQPTEGLAAQLHSMLQEQDSWTRLLSASALLMLGEGSPDLCGRRNSILNDGLLQSSQFTFPAALRAETEKEEFRGQLQEILDLVFLQTPTHSWLKPELFDPNHPASKFFLSSPRQFFALAAEALDPKGETDLARWR